MLLRSADDLDPGDDLGDWDLIVGLSPCRWANCCSGDSVASDLMFGSMGNCSFVCVVVGVQLWLILLLFDSSLSDVVERRVDCLGCILDRCSSSLSLICRQSVQVKLRIY